VSGFTGLRAWLVQRASAIYMLSFIAFALAHFFADPPHHYREWRAWITSPGVAIGTTLFFGALLAHAWVGLRDVILDYVHALAFRAALLWLLGIGLATTGVWVTRVLWVRG
jgi:succinate dehydrogenase / fumarate reductase membrane anchor subunit